MSRKICIFLQALIWLLIDIIDMQVIDVLYEAGYCCHFWRPSHDIVVNEFVVTSVVSFIAAGSDFVLA